MEVEFLRRFYKDLDKIKTRKDKDSILSAIDLVKSAESIDQIPSISKLSGYQDAYRIRCGNYRIGVLLDSGTITFARVAHRKEIYELFP